MGAVGVCVLGVVECVCLGRRKMEKRLEKKKRGAGVGGVGGLRSGGGERMGKWVEWYIEI